MKGILSAYVGDSVPFIRVYFINFVKTNKKKKKCKCRHLFLVCLIKPTMNILVRLYFVTMFHRQLLHHIKAVFDLSLFVIIPVRKLHQCFCYIKKKMYL